MVNRLNLVNPVRVALELGGYSTVRVVNAVNAALGQLEKVSSESKSGNGSVSKGMFKVSETLTIKYKGERNDPLDFDAWHSAIARANKIAEFESVSLPVRFNDWLAKLKETPASVPA